jgi:hypothetical protein
MKLGKQKYHNKRGPPGDASCTAKSLTELVYAVDSLIFTRPHCAAASK